MYVIGIAGGSGSGKTTFAKKILRQLESSRVGILHQDSYYKTLNGSFRNFDHPDAFDWELLQKHLKILKSGQAIDVPIYDYKTSQRTQQTEKLGPCEALIFEGIYALWNEQVRNLLDLRIFLQVESDIRFIRRLHRDVRERARTVDGIIEQYYDTVRPMYHEFLEPTQQYADLIVPEDTDVAADVVAAKLERILG